MGSGTAEPPVLLLPNDVDGDFAQFYRDEHDGQVRRAFLLLGRTGTAHDVVADAFLAVYQRWGTIAEPGPYLNRCVLNGCRDVHRLAPRERPVAEPTTSVVQRDRVDEMAELLLDLPFRQRAAIVLRFYGGYGEADIAAQLDCRPGTVGSLIHRGLAALRKDLIEIESTDR